MAQTYEDKPTLEAWNALAEAAGSAPKIAYGTYIGNGKYGAQFPNTLAFDFEPKLVIIQSKDYAFFDMGDSNDSFQTFLFLRPLRTFLMKRIAISCDITWGTNSVSWYSSSVRHQLNLNNWEYYYIAIG